MKNSMAWILSALVLMGSVAAALAAGPGQTSKPEGYDQEVAKAVRAVLDDQVAAWNRGDVEGFMNGYLRSPDTVFISGDVVTRGWQTVLDRYKKNYSSLEKMGTLAFTDLEVNVISPDAAIVVGRWQLTRSDDHPHGRFTLIFRRTPQGWRIIHDHTSTA